MKLPSNQRRPRGAPFAGRRGVESTQNVRRRDLVKIATLMLLMIVPSSAGAACPDWAAMGKYADIEAATVVFEGTVAGIEPGDVHTCAPERVMFTAHRVWKGEVQSQYTLLQANSGRVTERQPDGTMTNRGCPSDRFTAPGERSIVLASGPADRLGAMGCGTSKPPTARERRRLDKWKAKRE